MRPDDIVVTARAGRVEHGRRPRGRRAVALADDRAHGLRAGRPSLRRGSQAELEGRSRRRPDARHRIARPRVRRLDERCRWRAQGRRAYARICLRNARPGRALARRRTRRRGLVHHREHVAAHDVEHRHRAMVTWRRGRPPGRRVRRRRASRSALQARAEHPLPVSGRVPRARRAPEARTLPVAPSPAARVDRRLPRPRGRRGLRGALGHVHRRWLRPGRDEHRHREPRGRSGEARLPRAGAARAITSA